MLLTKIVVHEENIQDTLQTNNARSTTQIYQSQHFTTKYTTYCNITYYYSTIFKCWQNAYTVTVLDKILLKTISKIQDKETVEKKSWRYKIRWYLQDIFLRYFLKTLNWFLVNPLLGSMLSYSDLFILTLSHWKSGT